MTPNPFQPTRLAGITLKNRILRSATHEGLADESGAPLPALTQKYLQLAKGGVGAIITGYAGVRPEGRCAYHRMLMIDRDELIPAYRTLTDAVHAAGTPLFLQLAHAGRQTRSQVTGLQPVAPSAIRDHMFNEEVPRALKETEIEEIISAFVAGAVRAQAAGFDGVQLHGAHGYLLSEFLSPYMNQRTDRWGGSAENRFRIVGEIIARVKARLPGFPIFIKINGTDGRKNGMRIPEAVEIARRLEQAGAVMTSWLQFLLEMQRDWTRHDSYEAARSIVVDHGGGRIAPDDLGVVVVLVISTLLSAAVPANEAVVQPFNQTVISNEGFAQIIVDKNLKELQRVSR